MTNRIWLGLALLVASVPAFSHELIAQYGPFFGPALHIFGEVDHLAAFVALGLLAGQNARPERVAGIALFGMAFFAAMVLPQFLSDLSAAASYEGLFSAASVLAAGLLVVLGRPLPRWLIGLVAIAMGSLHGIANGLAVPASGQWVLSALGGTAAAVGIALAATWIAAVQMRPTGKLVVRVLGSWAAALGLMLMGLALRA